MSADCHRWDVRYQKPLDAACHPSFSGQQLFLPTKIFKRRFDEEGKKTSALSPPFTTHFRLGRCHVVREELTSGHHPPTPTPPPPSSMIALLCVRSRWWRYRFGCHLQRSCGEKNPHVVRFFSGRPTPWNEFLPGKNLPKMMMMVAVVVEPLVGEVFWIFFNYPNVVLFCCCFSTGVFPFPKALPPSKPSPSPQWPFRYRWTISVVLEILRGQCLSVAICPSSCG